MTRPIDADKVSESLQDFVDRCRDGRKQGAEFCLDCVIPNTPTLEAIPIAWIIEHYPLNGVAGTEAYFRKAHSIREAVDEWRNELTEKNGC